MISSKAPYTTAETLATSAMAAYLRQVESYEAGVIKDKDSENLHQMRVNLRRLRTVMQIFAPSILLPETGNERAIARVARQLGKLRDLDVIIATLKDVYLPDLPKAEISVLKTVLKSLKQKRKRRYQQVKSLLKSKRYRMIKSALQGWIDQPHCNATAHQDIYTILPDLTLPMVSHLWLHPGWLVSIEPMPGRPSLDGCLDAAALDAVIAHHGNLLHSLRKQIKRTRYQLKVVSQLYRDRLTDDLTRLSHLQEILGQLQDSWVIATCLDRMRPQLETQLPTLISRLQFNRCQAWKQWQALQKYYLDPENRANLRAVLMQPELPPNANGGLRPSENLE